MTWATWPARPRGHVWLAFLGLFCVLLLGLGLGAYDTGSSTSRNIHNSMRGTTTRNRAVNKSIASLGTFQDATDGESPSANFTAARVLTRRQDDYSCGPGRPCANGACCGPNGWVITPSLEVSFLYQLLTELS